MTKPLAVGVVGPNIIIDCRTHEEALRLAEAVTFASVPPPDALRAALHDLEQEVASARRLAVDATRGPEQAFRWHHYAEGAEEGLRIFRDALASDPRP